MNKYSFIVAIFCCFIVLMLVTRLEISPLDASSNPVKLSERSFFSRNQIYSNNAKSKVLVIYAYVEIKSKYDYARTLKYFIDLGVDENDQVDYLFVIQGRKISVDIPKYRNVKVFKRPNDWFIFCPTLKISIYVNRKKLDYIFFKF
jgi:hypothetical protein